jgi:glyoxylase-like metal-dependent hydrolase (beta-lactamase superfamily II)
MEKIKCGNYEILKFVFNPIKENCYVLNLENDSIVVDPGNSNTAETNLLIEAIKSPNLTIFNTHGHVDHIFGNAVLKEKFKSAKLVIHTLDREKLQDPHKNYSIGLGVEVISPDADIVIEGEESEYTLGNTTFRILHTKGHTLGSVSIVGDGFVFTGDTLFQGTVGIAKEYSKAFDDLITSIKTKLIPLGDNYIVLPGHGENTTILEERESNPFLQ